MASFFVKLSLRSRAMRRLALAIAAIIVVATIFATRYMLDDIIEDGVTQSPQGSSSLLNSDKPLIVITQTAHSV